MTYISFIENEILSKNPDEPFTVKELAEAFAKEFKKDIKKASALTSATLKRIVESDRIPGLTLYKKGIYFRKTDSNSLNERDMMIKFKYISGCKGYITVPGSLEEYMLKVNTERKTVICTNAASDCIRYDSELDVYTKPPKTEITPENILYLKILDVADSLEKEGIDNDNSFKTLAEKIRELNLDYRLLLKYAYEWYSRRTVSVLAKTACF